MVASMIQSGGFSQGSAKKEGGSCGICLLEYLGVMTTWQPVWKKTRETDSFLWTVTLFCLDICFQVNIQYTDSLAGWYVKGSTLQLLVASTQKMPFGILHYEHRSPTYFLPQTSTTHVLSLLPRPIPRRWRLSIRDYKHPLGKGLLFWKIDNFCRFPRGRL